MLLLRLKIMLAALSFGVPLQAAGEELFPSVENRVTYQKVVVSEGFDAEEIAQHFLNLLESALLHIGPWTRAQK